MLGHEQRDLPFKFAERSGSLRFWKRGDRADKGDVGKSDEEMAARKDEELASKGRGVDEAGGERGLNDEETRRSRSDTKG